jgi:thioredoxin-like negative regulator of GroEL
MRTGIALVLLSLAAQPVFADNSCKVVHHPPPSDADTAFLAADFPAAAGLYQAAMAKNPGNADSMIGLVHALLRQNKVQEAGDALQAATTSAPESPAMMTLRGEIELRQGEPWKATKTAVASYTADPCNPRSMLLLFKLETLNSQYATAHKMLTKAHQIDSEDPEIRAEWIKTLPVEQRVPEMEAYLAAPRGDSAAELSDLKTELYQLKAWGAEPRKPCTMVSAAATAEVPFVPILSNNDRTIAFGLSVKVNNHAARLAIDTSYNARLPIEGVSGLLISRAVAQHSGLKPVFQNEVPGTGPQGPRSGFVAIADSIAFGDVEYHNCAVQVMDVNFGNGAEGVVGLELLSNYLITLDYPAKKLILETLPPRPTDTVGTNGLYNRYVAPTMKDYTPVLTSGSDLIVPLSINGSPPMLWVLDTAVGPSMVWPGAAYQLTTGHKDPKFENRASKANWSVITLSGDNALSFAGVSLKETPIYPFDTSRFTDDTGMEISGMLGLKTMSRTTVHIDYRDGLVKFDYDPSRKGPLLF